MQISSRFTIAVHVLVAIETFKDEYKITSEFLASSVNVNPTVIRRLLQQLKKADIITVKRGSGGADIERPLEDITLLDVYNAVEPVENGELFHFHENPNELCPVGRNIHRIMDYRLEEIQKAMEDKMKSVTIADVMKDANELIEK
ncbi:MAG: Rrf2 family transcriptional regulator [Firmicutes bacterium]|nr:Rrf2 family transcriptional regulator [Bacillota bacterium]MBQ6607720.1 Rrf2 family transcriptional regulator [Bacillota bacterium]